MRGVQRLLQRSLQVGAAGEALAAQSAASGGELVSSCRLLVRTAAAGSLRSFAFTAQQAWRGGATRPAAASFAASQVGLVVAPMRRGGPLSQCCSSFLEKLTSGRLFLLCHISQASAQPLVQLHKMAVRQFGFAASALKASRSVAGRGVTGVGAALRAGPKGMAGSSLARQAGRRLKSSIVHEFKSMPNAAEVRGAGLASPTAATCVHGSCGFAFLVLFNAAQASSRTHLQICELPIPSRRVC